jgi:hypothetical protein
MYAEGTERSGLVLEFVGFTHILATAPGFVALSRFEQWEQLRHQTAVAATELENLDALDLTLKSQLLEWMAGSRDATRRAD